MSTPQLDPTYFAYWLKGYCEITNRRMPSSGEWVIINDHLDAVFTKVTPERNQLDITNWSGSYRPFVFDYNDPVTKITPRVC